MSISELSSDELARRWQERVRTGNLSKAVISIGTIRVMGKSGDAAIQFPRIASLDALGTLEADEQYAVQVAQRIVTQAAQESRTVFAVAPGQTPERLTGFKPDAESLMVVARIAGG